MPRKNAKTPTFTLVLRDVGGRYQKYKGSLESVDIDWGVLARVNLGTISSLGYVPKSIIDPPKVTFTLVPNSMDLNIDLRP